MIPFGHTYKFTSKESECQQVLVLAILSSIELVHSWSCCHMSNSARPPHSSLNLPDAQSKSNPPQLDQVWASAPISEKSSSIWVDTDVAGSTKAIDKRKCRIVVIVISQIQRKYNKWALLLCCLSRLHFHKIYNIFFVLKNCLSLE